jgi:hypothetical protein
MAGTEAEGIRAAIAEMIDAQDADDAGRLRSLLIRSGPLSSPELAPAASVGDPDQAPAAGHGFFGDQ